MAEGKVCFREVATDTKPYRQMMDTIKGYINNISAADTNYGNAYLLLSNNMNGIVANNTTLTNTVAKMQK